MYQINKGVDCLTNFSRKALVDASQVFPNFVVLNITAAPQVLAKRLSARGRETRDDIARRLAEAQKPLPPKLNVITLSNDGPLNKTVTRAVTLLQPAQVRQ